MSSRRKLRHPAKSIYSLNGRLPKFLGAALSVVVLALPPSGQAQEPALIPPLEASVPASVATTTLQECIQQALSQNQSLWAKRHEVDAAGERITVASSFANPQLGVMGWPSGASPQWVDGRMSSETSFSQKTLWPGKRQLDGAAAQAEFCRQKSEYSQFELETIESVTMAYAELRYYQTILEVFQQSRKLSDDLRAATEAKYRVATATQQDVLRAEFEQKRVDLEILQLAAESTAAHSRLVALLHLPFGEKIQTVANDRQQLELDLEKLLDLALRSRPDIRAADIELARTQLLTQRAVMDYKPDITWNVNLGTMTDRRAMSPLAENGINLGLGVMLDLPLYRSRLDAAIRDREASSLAAARTRDAAMDRATQQVVELVALAQAQKAVVDLYNSDLVPLAKQTLEASAGDYRNNRVDLLQLVDNWRKLLDSQIARSRTEMQLQKTFASLERAVGGQLTPNHEATQPALESAALRSVPSSPRIK